MDQVKLVLAVLKKQHFWVLSGILVIVGLGSWYSAAGKLATQYQERETKLNTQRKAVQDITKSTDPPNQSVIDAIGESHKKTKDEVYRAWTLLYGVQKENNPWPPPPVLSEEFIAAAEALKPGENYLKAGEEFKDWKYPEQYWNFIKDYLPQLGVIVDVREPKASRAERLKPKAARRPVVKKKIEKKKLAENATAAEKKAAEESAEEEMVGKVDWDEANEFAIRQQFEWDTRPTTLQVLIAQENLWVYQALLRIIRDTNEGSGSYYKSPVKQIFSLEIGREAAGAMAGGRGPGGMGMGMGMPGMTGGMGSSGYMSAMSMAGSSGAATPGSDAVSGMGMAAGGDASAGPQDAIARALLDGRYVDQKGQPLQYGTEPPFPQFKMMPVRMMLLVDQRRVPRLLAQCANSSMPVEVKRVILRPDQVQALSLGGPAGSGGPSGMPGGGMPKPGGAMGAMGSSMYAGAADAVSGSSMPGARSGGMSASAMMRKGGSRMPSSSGSMPGAATGMPGASSGGDEESPWDMKVEIQGIIYIFNPPDRSKFDIGEPVAAGAGASPAAGTQPGGPATPAAASPDAAVPAKPSTPAVPGAPGTGGAGPESAAPSGAGATPAASPPGPTAAPAAAPKASAGTIPTPAPGTAATPAPTK